MGECLFKMLELYFNHYDWQGRKLCFIFDCIAYRLYFVFFRCHAVLAKICWVQIWYWKELQKKKMKGMNCIQCFVLVFSRVKL